MTKIATRRAVSCILAYSVSPLLFFCTHWDKNAIVKAEYGLQRNFIINFQAQASDAIFFYIFFLYFVDYSTDIEFISFGRLQKQAI